MAGRAGCSWGSRRALNTPCWTPCHMLFLLLTGYAVFYSWVPAREGLPRHLKSLGWEDSLEKEMATLFSILAWEIPWTEDPCGLQSLRSQEWYNLVTKPAEAASGGGASGGVRRVDVTSKLESEDGVAVSWTGGGRMSLLSNNSFTGLRWDRAFTGLQNIQTGWTCVASLPVLAHKQKTKSN